MAAEDDKVTATRVQIVEALRAGAAAAKSGAACPYSPNGNATERVLCAAWVRGLTRARRAD